MKRRRLAGGIIYWAAMLLALFGVISTIMALAAFEGEERLTGTLNWAGFALAAVVIGLAARRVLLK